MGITIPRIFSEDVKHPHTGDVQIATDFHFQLKKDKVNLPWYNYDAMLALYNLQQEKWSYSLIVEDSIPLEETLENCTPFHTKCSTTRKLSAHKSKLRRRRLQQILASSDDRQELHETQKPIEEQKEKLFPNIASYYPKKEVSRRIKKKRRKRNHFQENANGTHAFHMNIDPIIDEIEESYNLELELMAYSETEESIKQDLSFRFPPFDSSYMYDVGKLEKNIDSKHVSDKPIAAENKREESTKASKGNKTILQIPINVCVDIKDFLHYPLCGSMQQNSNFFYSSPPNDQVSLEPRIVDTEAFFYEETYTYLLGYKTQEVLFATDKNDFSEGSQLAKVTTVHNQENKLSLETTENSYMKVPIVLGEYNVHIDVEKMIDLKENISNLTYLSKNLLVNSCYFVPTSMEKKEQGNELYATKGQLFIEATLEQGIEYMTHGKKNEFESQKFEENEWKQKIEMELLIQLLQVQKIPMPGWGSPTKIEKVKSPISDLLARLSPGSNVQVVTVNGKPIHVKSFGDYNTDTGISTFVLKDNHVISLQVEEIDYLLLG